MTRTLLFVIGAVALALALSVHQSQLAAQESADASAEAASDADTSSGEATADVSGEATAESSEASADTSGEASAEAGAEAQPSDSEAQPATSDPSTSGQSDIEASQQDATGERSPTLPQPTQGRDADRSHDADARADADIDGRSRTQDATRDLRSRDRDERGDARGEADRRGRADMRDGDRRGRDFDARRGIRFGRSTDRGLVVNEIERNSFYFEFGLREGDVIVSLHGRPIRSDAEFYRYVRHYHGERVPLIVLRDGRRETIYIEYPQDVVYRERPARGRAYLGVVFDTQARDAAVVHSVAPDSPAEEAGLQSGDAILALDGEEVMSYRDAISIVRSMRPGDRLDIVVARGQSEAQTEAVLGAQPLRTARAGTEVRVEERGVLVPSPAPGEVEMEIRDNDRRILDRDRDDDGRRDRGLLERILD